MEKDYKKLIEQAEKNQLIKLNDEELSSAIKDFEIYDKQFQLLDNIIDLDSASKSIFPYEFFGTANQDKVEPSLTKKEVLDNAPKHDDSFVITKKESK